MSCGGTSERWLTRTSADRAAARAAMIGSAPAVPGTTTGTPALAARTTIPMPETWARFSERSQPVATGSIADHAAALASSCAAPSGTSFGRPVVPEVGTITAAP